MPFTGFSAVNKNVSMNDAINKQENYNYNVLRNGIFHLPWKVSHSVVAQFKAIIHPKMVTRSIMWSINLLKKKNNDL